MLGKKENSFLQKRKEFEQESFENNIPVPDIRLQKKQYKRQITSLWKNKTYP